MTSSVLSDPAPRGSSDGWSLAPHRAPARHPERLLIAVASGGERVDRDFENADAFLLYERSGARTSYIGCQPCALAGAGGDAGRRSRLLADCDLVLCAGISDACRHTLSRLGVDCNLAYAGARITEAVAALADGPAN